MNLASRLDRLFKKAPQPPVTWVVSWYVPETGRVLHRLTVEPDEPCGRQGKHTEEWFDEETGKCINKTVR